MALSAQSIWDRRQDGLIIPMEYRKVHKSGLSYGLSAAGYDIRIAESLLLGPKEFTLASSLESFNMPHDLLGHVKDKSTWARQGLFVGNTVIEPGWRGFLTLELVNWSSDKIELERGEPIAQIIFELLDQPTEDPYDGKYQDQEPGQQPARFDRS